MVDHVKAAPRARAGDGDRKRARANGRGAAVVSFLEVALAGGPVAVAYLEARARTAGLLGDRQKITDAKIFKAAKKKVGIVSRRDGFGRSGEWFWELVASARVNSVEIAVNSEPAPASVTYADHTRPEHHHPGDQNPTTGLVSASGETTSTCRVPPEWHAGVAILNCLRPPANVPRHRWQLFRDDCERFLDERKAWAERAADLGWDTLALFGCDPRRPLDQPGAGLLWRLAGGTLTAIYRDHATYEINGREFVFHRRPASPNILKPWDQGTALDPHQ